MKNRFVSILLMLLVISGLTFQAAIAYAMSPWPHQVSAAPALQDDASSTSEADSWDCTLPLRVTVRQGPNAGLELFGLVHMNLDDEGAAEGVYELASPEAMAGEVPMVGQITGHAVNMMFMLPDDTQMYGVGTSQDPITSNCHTTWGGPVVGPGEGDMGDWVCTPDYCCGGGVCMRCQLVGSQNQCSRVQPGEVGA